MTGRPGPPYNACMFGLPSIQKLLVLAAIVLAVWYGFKLIGRLSEQRKAERKLDEQRGGADAGKRPRGNARAELKAEEMEPCPACGAYVAAGKARSCGRADCPY